MSNWPLFFLGMTLAIVLLGRGNAPSDLYDQDQPKTVTYTVDMVENGRWVLARDMHGRPSTKPPMYNWVGAPVYAMFGAEEWALRAPSWLGGLVVIGVIVGMARRFAVIEATGAPPGRAPRGARGRLPFSLREMALGLGVVAAVLWLGGYATVKLIWLARPDMLLTMFLLIGWATGTVLLTEGGDGRRRWALQAVLWLAVAGAALTKGPPALLVVAYLVVAARLCCGGWGAVGRTGMWWGLPLMIALAAAWAIPAAQADPEHFKKTFAVNEVIGRIIGVDELDQLGEEGVPTRGNRRNPHEIITEAWKMPAWFMARFAPWSLFVVLMFVDVRARGWCRWRGWRGMRVCTRRQVRLWFRHPLGPAFLWVAVTILFFSLSAGKRADYLAPAYPAGAILAAWWLVITAAKYRITPGRAAAAGMLVALVVTCISLYASPATRTGYGEHTRRFARQVAKEAGEERIAFINAGYNPLMALLGRNQAGETPTEQQLAEAAWVIQPVEAAAGAEAVVTSEPIPTGRHVKGKMEAVRLGLYRR